MKELGSDMNIPRKRYVLAPDAESVESVSYSVARANWLERAALQLADIDGDDTWVEWMKDHEELLKKGE